ncbi:MAG: MFS transporter [Elusimicrobia bacterium]|nr:MFS transporter [Elusimicrobiota bacterium]
MTPRNAAASIPSASPIEPPARARWALGVLLSINLVNYLDRYILSAVLPLVQQELHTTDAELGALASAFMVVYMCAAVPIAYLADRFSRKALLVFGVVFWSFATAASGFARSFGELFATRAAVGVGESCYGSISPSFVAEHFPPSKRAGALALFAMAGPVGSALGFVLGGQVGKYWGWREAFFVGGAPGLVLAWLAWRLRDPREGPARAETHAIPTFAEYLAIRNNPSLILCTLSMAAMTFGIGAFAVWMPTFYYRVWGMDLAKANLWFGAFTVASGILGSLVGGWLADRLYRVTSASYFLVSGAGFVLAVPLAFVAIWTKDLRVAMAALFFTEFFAFLNMGPLNAVIVGVTRPAIRSMAFAANIFVIHALGDAVSPMIVGRISDARGLQTALSVAAVSLAAAAAFCAWGARRYEADAREALKHA